MKSKKKLKAAKSGLKKDIVIIIAVITFFGILIFFDVIFLDSNIYMIFFDVVVCAGLIFYKVKNR